MWGLEDALLSKSLPVVGRQIGLSCAPDAAAASAVFVPEAAHCAAGRQLVPLLLL